MTQRISEVVRNTNETKIRVRVNLDGTGQGTLNTGVPFLDHMIDQIKRHGLFDIDIHCDGDLDIVSIAYDQAQNVHLWRNDAK